jgi:hypothetical protein
MVLKYLLGGGRTPLALKTQSSRVRIALRAPSAVCLLMVPLLLLWPRFGRAQSSLFYFEAQAVGGYATAEKSAVFYSMSRDEPMQKPSVGIDYLRRLSGEYRDFGALAFQLRLAYNHEPESDLELQIYNAWIRFKAPFGDLWIGHDRPAFGLASVLDSHALLLQPLGMHGYGFDRDWGAGLSRDFSWGGAACSFTTGSGMPLELDGSWFAAARISRGVLSRDNQNLGISLAWGKPLMTMGYTVVESEPYPFRMAAVDFTHLVLRFENRIEIMAGERMEEPSYALLWRFSVNFLEEARLKLELQPVLAKEAGEWNTLAAAGLSFRLNADVSLRTVYQHADPSGNNMFVAQVYYYKGW